MHRSHTPDTWATTGSQQPNQRARGPGQGLRTGESPSGLIYSSNCPALSPFCFTFRNSNLILSAHVAPRWIEDVGCYRQPSHPLHFPPVTGLPATGVTRGLDHLINTRPLLQVTLPLQRQTCKQSGHEVPSNDQRDHGFLADPGCRPVSEGWRAWGTGGDRAHAEAFVRLLIRFGRTFLPINWENTTCRPPRWVPPKCSEGHPPERIRLQSRFTRAYSAFGDPVTADLNTGEGL